jgi:hypothetical protein
MSFQAAVAALLLIPFIGFCVYTLIHVIRTLNKE